MVIPTISNEIEYAKHIQTANQATNKLSPIKEFSLISVNKNQVRRYFSGSAKHFLKSFAIDAAWTPSIIL